MPTRYWLVDPELRAAIGRLEAAGGVNRAEAEVDADALAAAHERYRAERDAALPPDHVGPRPSGGVGGTRTGVKCLHAHYAWYLAGGDDPVGALGRGQARRRGGHVSGGPVAAIDVGTNSVRLLVAEPGPSTARPAPLTTHERLMRITRLGAGVDANGRLDPAAIDRTVTVLQEYRERIDRLRRRAGAHDRHVGRP